MGQRLHLDSGTLTPLLKRLESAELLTRLRDVQDERRVLIRLTAAGRKLKARAARIPGCVLRGLAMQRVRSAGAHPAGAGLARPPHRLTTLTHPPLSPPASLQATQPRSPPCPPHLDKVVYTARAHTTGGREGTSRSDDGMLDVKLSPPKAMGGSGTATNPEQLFAAGYSACFMGALKHVAGLKKIAVPADAAIDAEVKSPQVLKNSSTSYHITIMI